MKMEDFLNQREAAREKEKSSKECYKRETIVEYYKMLSKIFNDSDLWKDVYRIKDGFRLIISKSASYNLRKIISKLSFMETVVESTHYINLYNDTKIKVIVDLNSILTPPYQEIVIHQRFYNRKGVVFKPNYVMAQIVNYFNICAKQYEKEE